MLKKSALLLLAVSLVFGLGSCKFIKEKFSKKKEIVKVDSLDEGLSESAYSDLSSDTGLMANTFDTTAQVTATESASSVSVTSTSNNNSKDAVASSNSQETSQSSSKSSNAKAEKAVSNDNQSKSISSKEKKTVADIDNASKGKRRGISTSIYDGINDQAERMIIRKAEGYNDYYYVDDYDGSNAEYEKHYKLASKIDGSKDYVIPANGSSSSVAKPVVKNKPQPSFEPQKVAETAKAEPKKVSESHIGDVPRKAPTNQPSSSEKPNSANDIIKKK